MLYFSKKIKCFVNFFLIKITFQILIKLYKLYYIFQCTYLPILYLYIRKHMYVQFKCFFNFCWLKLTYPYSSSYTRTRAVTQSNQVIFVCLSFTRDYHMYVSSFSFSKMKKKNINKIILTWHTFLEFFFQLIYATTTRKTTNNCDIFCVIFLYFFFLILL